MQNHVVSVAWKHSNFTTVLFGNSIYTCRARQLGSRRSTGADTGVNLLVVGSSHFKSSEGFRYRHGSSGGSFGWSKFASASVARRKGVVMEGTAGGLLWSDDPEFRITARICLLVPFAVVLRTTHILSRAFEGTIGSTQTFLSTSTSVIHKDSCCCQAGGFRWHTIREPLTLGFLSDGHSVVWIDA